jgi:hypothetical protein
MTQQEDASDSITTNFIITMVITPRRTGLAGHVPHMEGGVINADKILVRKPEVANYLGDLGIRGREKMDLKQRGCEDFCFTQLAQDNAQLLELVNKIMSSRVAYKGRGIY